MTPPLSLYNLVLTFLLVSCSSLTAQPRISTLPNSDERLLLELTVVKSHNCSLASTRKRQNRSQITSIRGWHSR